MESPKFSNDIVQYIHCKDCIIASKAGKLRGQRTVTALVGGYTQSGMLQLWCEDHGVALGFYNVSPAPVKSVT